MAQPILITNFNGQAENPHIGAGVNVGVDLYTTKNVARLSRKMEKKSGTEVNALPLFCVQTSTAAFSNIQFVQLENGKILTSTNDGDSWSALGTQPTGTNGKGLTVWQDYLWAFNATGVDLYGPLSGSPAWINSWTGFTGGTALINNGNVEHIPFPNPSSNTVLYITNSNYIAQVKVISFPFNPGSSLTYETNNKKFTMPSFYNAKCIGFMPPSFIGIGVENTLSNSQADIILWDGVSDTTATNAVNLPGAAGPVTNLLTKNGIMYAVTTNDVGVYSINGSSATLIDRLALRMTNRSSGGKQYTTRVQPNVRIGSADFLGPELLIGICNYPSPVTQISGTGLYPYGIWAVNVEDKIVYTKFPLSHGDINAQYSTSYDITFVKVLANSKVIAGWAKSTTYGIDALNAANYISDTNTTFIESELYEVGTRIEPMTFNQIAYNLVEPLKTGEEISFYYRLSQGEDYTLFWNDTSTTLSGNLGGIITPLPFQQAKYVQFGVRMKTDASTPNETPQLVSVYLK